MSEDIWRWRTLLCLCLVWGLIPQTAWGLPPPTPSRQTLKSLFTFTKHWHCPQPSQPQHNRERVREKPTGVTMPGLRYYSDKLSFFRPPWTPWSHLKEKCYHIFRTSVHSPSFNINTSHSRHTQSNTGALCTQAVVLSVETKNHYYNASKFFTSIGYLKRYHKVQPWLGACSVYH